MRTKKWVNIVVGIVAIISLISLSVSGCGSFFRKGTASEIKINGSTTVFPIAQTAAEEFMKENPSVNVSVRGTGSGNGIASLISGTCDIADASRPMKQSEINMAKANGINPVPHIIAKDAIAIIVNPNNTISKISHIDLRRIYSGEITNWKDLGGPNMKIVPVTRDSSSGTFEIFEEKVLGKGTEMVSTAVVQGSNQTVKTTVAKTPGAIGYIGLGYADNSVKVLKYDGVNPSKETVADSMYELSRPLFMYTNGKPEGNVKKFIDFVLSPEGQRIVEKVGYIAVRPVR